MSNSAPRRKRHRVNRVLTLGSLFDGSGGFPLAAMRSGIEPLWASEIEPFPIRVTHKRIPWMVHLGDINALNGADIPPVDIVTFGSPCQNMSVAGDNTGIHGTESSLFFEAIRVITEMEDATNGRYPKYAVWENVPGAFTSNKGEDFREAIECFCRIKDRDIYVPGCKKWQHAGEVLGDSFSVAWRVFDAQYWGVPQRRKRIYLVADLRGQSAGEILFTSKELSEYDNKVCTFRQRSAGTSQDSSGESGSSTVWTLRCRCGHTGNGGRGTLVNKDIAMTLACSDKQIVFIPEPVYGIERYATEAGQNASFKPIILEDIQPALVARGKSAVYTDHTVRYLTPLECVRLQGFPDGWCDCLIDSDPSNEEIKFWSDVFETYRLTVTHATRPKTEKQIRKWLAAPPTDSAQYKMWGNGIALPCAQYVLGSIADHERSTHEQSRS